MKNGRKILSNVIDTQISIHEKFGGVVPEIASRNHVEAISNVMKKSLEDAKVEINDIDESHILPMPSMLVKADTQYLDRVANVDGKLILLLDVEKLLSDDEAEDVKKITEELQNG